MKIWGHKQIRSHYLAWQILLRMVRKVEITIILEPSQIYPAQCAGRFREKRFFVSRAGRELTLRAPTEVFFELAGIFSNLFGKYQITAYCCAEYTAIWKK